jgi:uncharacterized membrane protein YphA (DoxX/SURF4 family)
MAERTSPPISIVLLLNRISLGLFFFMAGLGKVRGGVGAFFEKYFEPNLPNLVPQWFGYAYGYSLPWLELFAGLMLLVGLYTRLASAAMVFMLASITIAMGVTQGGGPFNKTLIMMTLAILLWTMGPGAISVDAAFFKRRRRRL